MRKFNQLRRLVLALSGADEEILRYVPSERTRFESLGWAILITSFMAMISMWFALSSALSVNGILAIPVAVFWGLVIMGIDRWLITSMPVDGGRKFVCNICDMTCEGAVPCLCPRLALPCPLKPRVRRGV